MSVIMDYGSYRLARVFFGCLPDEVKKTVFLTLGIPWLFKKISSENLWLRGAEVGGISQ